MDRRHFLKAAAAAVVAATIPSIPNLPQLGELPQTQLDFPWIIPPEVEPTIQYAYSARKLLSAYNGPVMRIRRLADGAERDFYATLETPFGTQVDCAAIEEWVGHSGHGVVKLYNQAGDSKYDMVTSDALNWRYY